MAITNNLYVIAAICGNFYQESTVNPGIWENLTVGAPGYGLGQWTNNATTNRRTALFNYLHDNNFPIDSGQGQLEFLMYENIWVPSLFVQSSYNTLYQFIASSSTNLYDLVQEFMYHWEGINDSSFNTRYQWAQTFLALFQNDSGTREPWTTGNFYCTEQQTINNALLIKDFFTGETPPEPPEPPEPPYEPTEEEIVAIFRYLLRKRGKGGFHITI